MEGEFDINYVGHIIHTIATEKHNEYLYLPEVGRCSVGLTAGFENLEKYEQLHNYRRNA